MKIIAVSNQKGGVGKTTTVANLAASMASFGFRTLVVDLDPQGNASSAFGIYADNEDALSLYECLHQPKKAVEAVRSSVLQNLDILPSSQNLSGVELELAATISREGKLQKVLSYLPEQYDYVFIDTPPTLGLLTVNALTAADAVLVPMQAEYYAMEGLSQLLNTIALIKEHLNPSLEVDSILITMFDKRNNLAKQVKREIEEHFSEKVLQVVIPRNVKLSEAPSYGKPAIVYDVLSKGSIAYLKAAEEILLRHGHQVRKSNNKLLKIQKSNK